MRLLAVVLLAVVLSSTCTQAQSWSRSDTLVVMSYNVENFFCPEDDPLKNDDAFTPDGSYIWTMDKANRKALKVARVILSASDWHFPDIVGLCEVEGPKAVDILLKNGGLSRCGYRGVCFPTPDDRGIATALLYRGERVELLDSTAIDCNNVERGFVTRHILHCKLLCGGRDTVHVMVNHWPSKYGGEAATIWRREYVADIAKHHCDSLLKLNPDSKIILLGDFNEGAKSVEICERLGATPTGPLLFNMSGKDPLGRQSYKYRSAWETIDHIIISKYIYDNCQPLFVVGEKPWLLEPDLNNKDYKPFRTYVGQKFNDGYSDHLPVLLKIQLK
ncbi:MAG: hypothetical protein HUJ96_07370 [Marinilabiliaceae bacterium]|nr:hypothetical protein [Marinilabiliaceae bacterium]